MAVDDPRSLATLLPHLASILADVPLDAPVAVGIACGPAGLTPSRATEPEVEFFFRHLDCADVMCSLGGFVAPAHWDAFGVIVPGHRILVEAASPHASDAPNHEVTACALVARDGLVVSEVRTLDGEVLARGDTEGRAVDACRRVLSLATAPPLFGPQVWRTLRWIDRVLADVLDADLGDAPAWYELEELRELDSPAEILDLSFARRHAPLEWTWHELRIACADASIEVPGIDPTLAVWMDDGLFAREAMASLPQLVDSLGDLRQLLPPNTFDRIIAEVSDQLAA